MLECFSRLACVFGLPLFFVASLNSTSKAQVKPSQTQNRPTELPTYLGSKTPYAAPISPRYEEAPAGCRPIHIAGVHRHGSRYLNADDGIRYLLGHFETAEQKNELTAKGRMALQWLRAAAEEFNSGNLTMQGERELYALGKRTYEKFPEVFARNDRKIVLSATF